LNAGPLIDAILQFLGRGTLLSAADVRIALEREIASVGAGELLALEKHLTVDDGWAYYPPDPLARRIHHLLADRFLAAGSRVVGLDHLATVADAPVVIVSNHLSYADANVVEILLRRAGARALADRLTALAGPKIFSSRERRFSSLCFGTIKVPQSADVSSEEAVLQARDVARAARRAIEVAHDRLEAGDALILFGEGTRSRSGGLQRMLPAVARYLERPGTWVLPVGLTGPDALFPVGGALTAATVTMTVGRPRRTEVLTQSAGGNRRILTDALGLAIADLLPAEYRGVYSDTSSFPEAATIYRL
jgi:1-acyl-sn-glycerol-3-phosphate acyltransferase